MGLQGTIETLPAAGVLSALTAHGSSGVLEIRGGANRLSLSLLNGFLVAGDMTGDMAGDMTSVLGASSTGDGLRLRLVDVLCAMELIESGAYEFRDGAIERPNAERIALDDVLGRATAAAVALHSLGSSAPSIKAVLMIVESNEDGPITLNRSMLRVVAQVDSSRSVAQIASLIGLSAYEAAAHIAELIALGILCFSPTGSPDLMTSKSADDLDPRIAEATRESLELAARLVQGHRLPHSDEAERALAELASGDERPTEVSNANDLEHESIPDQGLEGSYSQEENQYSTSGDIDQTTITADRGALLRLFSGLRADNG